MNTEQKIKMALAYAGISQAELARRLGTSPQNFNPKMKNGTFTLEDFEKMATALGASWSASFEFPDGTRV